MAGFFETGGVTGSGGSTIDEGTLATIVSARTDAVAAKDAALGAQSAAGAAATTAQQSAATAAAAISTVNTAAASVATQLTAAQAAAAAAATSQASVGATASSLGSAVVTAQTAATGAQSYSDTAYRLANEQPGVDIDGAGTYSGRHYANACKVTAQAALKVPTRLLQDADFTSNNYNLQASDLGKYIVSLKTTAGTISLPAGLDTQPGIGWVHVVRRGAGAITIQGAGSSVIPVSLLAEQNFVYGVATPVASYTPSPGHSLAVPAGTSRKVVLFLQSIHDAVNASRSMSMAVTNTSGLTKQATGPLDGYFTSNSGARILQTVWTATIADGFSGSIVASPTLDLPDSYALWMAIVGNSSGWEIPNATADTGSAAPGLTYSIAGTPTVVNGMLLFGLGAVGADALPLTVTAPASFTPDRSGKTSLSRSAKDIASVFGHLATSALTATTFTISSAKSSWHSGAIIHAKPAAGASSVVITGGGTPSLASTGAHADIFVDPDGVTYDVRVY